MLSGSSPSPCLLLTLALSRLLLSRLLASLKPPLPAKSARLNRARGGPNGERAGAYRCRRHSELGEGVSFKRRTGRTVSHGWTARIGWQVRCSGPSHEGEPPIASTQDSSLPEEKSTTCQHAWYLWHGLNRILPSV
jgi:hypothetical protein